MKITFALVAMVVSTLPANAQPAPTTQAGTPTVSIDDAPCAVFGKNGDRWMIGGHAVDFGGPTLANLSIAKGVIRTPKGDAWQLIEDRCGK